MSLGRLILIPAEEFVVVKDGDPIGHTRGGVWITMMSLGSKTRL